MFCARVGAGCPDRAKSDPRPAGRGVLPKPGADPGRYLPPHDHDCPMSQLTESDIQSRVAGLADLRAAIATAIVGQHDVVEQLLTGLLAGGHCLLEGVPGLGKTLLVRTLGQALELQFRRVQFTPDLMPSDLLGTELLEEDHGTGRRAFRFQQGPVFTNLLLADELNRTPPKTHAALLEAMQEHTVSFAGVTHALPEPFFVLATQNPIDQAGTYPLPEAQLDRFLLHIALDYPDAEEERAIIAQTTGARVAQVPRVMGGAEVLELQRLVREVHVGDELLAWITRIVRATRPGAASPPPRGSRGRPPRRGGEAPDSPPHPRRPGSGGCGGDGPPGRGGRRAAGPRGAAWARNAGLEPPASPAPAPGRRRAAGGARLR